MVKGTNHSTETKARIAASLTGTKGTPAKSRAISAAIRGKPKSPEHRENLRQSAIARLARSGIERPYSVQD